MKTAIPSTAKDAQNPASSPRRALPSPDSGRLAQLAAMMNHSPRVQAQLKLADEIQNSEPVQRHLALAAQMNQAPVIQPRLKEEETAQSEAAPAPNNTGLPDQLKAGVESLSGISLDDVKVHYNSAKPTQLNALAYAQGTDIHVASGQEKHLPHEAWHIVQQKQGRVQPTMQMKAGTPVNDDPGLEREADIMGAKAVAVQRKTAEARVSQVGFSESVAQLKTYVSKTDENFKVETSSNPTGTYAQATKPGEEYETSSLEYKMRHYMNATGEGGTVPTKVAMATQTNTMHAYPERKGVGTLLLGTAMDHLEANQIQYFQPDIMASVGGGAMLSMISGEKLAAPAMEKLISETDTVHGVKTYPAIKVNMQATKAALRSQVAEKFTEFGAASSSSSSSGAAESLLSSEDEDVEAPAKGKHIRRITFGSEARFKLVITQEHLKAAEDIAKDGNVGEKEIKALKQALKEQATFTSREALTRFVSENLPSKYDRQAEEIASYLAETEL